MHRALETPEIITLILRYAKTPDGSTDNPTLAAVARTCRILSDIALDLLWERQEGLVNFIRCMPEDAWVLEPVSEGEDGYVAHDKPRARLNLTRDIIPGDWSRFNFYASRTKDLTLYDHGMRLRVALPAATLTVLALSCPVNPLFPSLQNVHAQHAPKSHINFLPTLVSPALRRFALSDDCLPTWHCIYIVAYVAHRSRDLEELRLDLGTGEVDIALLQESLESFRKLRLVDLRLPPGSDICSMFKSMTLCPSLSSITIIFPRTPTPIIRPDVLRDLVETQHFTRIAEVYFRSIGSISVMSRLLPIFSSSALKTLVLSFSCCFTEVAQQLLVDIGRHIDHATLQRLEVNFLDLDSLAETGDPYPALSLAAFIPLRAFRQMRIFAFNADADLDLDDEDFRDVVKSWPMLRELHLPKFRGLHLGHVPKLTLGTLLSLADYCPMLEMITVALDATAVNASGSSRPAAGITLPSLTRLDISGSPIRSPLDVALFLSDLCPQRCDIDWYTSPYAASVYKPRWLEVQSLLGVLCIVRR
ncbi:hypothetical protein CERSUDRAFT_114574 [Gelatoporia subvermispora B]|uniref:F-box domain-containing protein n=1 Tax=Ceriporiopsis subvermispora (strain B) TaxID=914234 RepID=M2QLQ3_CERS8|nr:hypothetical protein CERSUDRAFT_114574 [Gelatoporia subvermispora B]